MSEIGGSAARSGIRSDFTTVDGFAVGRRKTRSCSVAEPAAFEQQNGCQHIRIRRSLDRQQMTGEHHAEEFALREFLKNLALAMAERFCKLERKPHQHPLRDDFGPKI